MVNTEVKISVLTAVRNGEKYLNQAVESVLRQTLVDFEFIIIDDASTDNTASLLKDYARRDARVKIITNAQNLGLTKSLNLGLRAARGQYVARFDADDICRPERLQTQYDFMESHPDVALCGARGQLIDKRGQVVGEKNFPLDYADIKRALIKNNQFIHSAWCARRDLLLSLGGYDESFIKSQDYELALRLAARYPVVNLPERLVAWRLRGDSLSWSNKRQEWDALRARFLAITRYGYPKLSGLKQILFRAVYLLIPQRLKLRQIKLDVEPRR